MLLRRVLRRRLVRVSIETEVLRRVLRRGGCYRRRLEGRSTPFRRVRPPSRAPYWTDTGRNIPKWADLNMSQPLGDGGQGGLWKGGVVIEKENHDPCKGKSFNGENLNGGLANRGLRSLSTLPTIVHDCLRLSSFCESRKFPLQKGGPKGPQKHTIVNDCAQIAEGGLKPQFGSLHLDFPTLRLRFVILVRSVLAQTRPTLSRDLRI